MNMKRIVESGPALQPEDLAAFEQRHNIRLPEDYREFMLRSNGGAVSETHGWFHAVIERRHKGMSNAFSSTALLSLLSLKNSSGETLESVFLETKQIKKLSAYYLLIGVCNARKGFVLISLRKEDYGHIYLWDLISQEAQRKKTPVLYPVADSFSAFLDMLTTDEESRKRTSELWEKEAAEMGIVYQKNEEKEKKPLTEAEIAAFERFIKKSLPEDYKAFLRTDNGTCERSANIFDFFDVERQRMDRSDIRFYCAGGGKSYANLESAYDIYKGRIPDDCLAIGDDSYGNQICLELSKKRFGKIWFWPHDSYGPEGSFEPMSPIADSFSAFLEMLHEISVQDL